MFLPNWCIPSVTLVRGARPSSIPIFSLLRVSRAGACAAFRSASPPFFLASTSSLSSSYSLVLYCFAGSTVDLPAGSRAPVHDSLFYISSYITYFASCVCVQLSSYSDVTVSALFLCIVTNFLLLCST